MLLHLDELVAQLSVALDAVEGDLVGASAYHGKRVAMLCLRMGIHLGFGQEKLLALACCALMHDSALTEYILSERPGREQALNLKSHCRLGQRNIELLPLGEDADGLVLYHHERADGKGPFGLGEGEFPLGAGVIALADQLDVAYHLNRRGPKDLPEMRGFVSANAESRFCRDAAAALLAVLDEGLLAGLSDARIPDSLAQNLPVMVRELSNGAALGLATMVGRIIDYKSTFTRKHSVQIANKSWIMSGVYDVDVDRRCRLYLAAALHDVGKLFIPSSILEKPGALTPEEFGVIKNHVSRTWELLRPVTGLEEVAVWAADHHEKLDGSGYPFGKTASGLDFFSRLLACLDIYQAVSEERPYHPRRAHAETMAVLRQMAGRGQLDGGIADSLDSLAALGDDDAPDPALPS